MTTSALSFDIAIHGAGFVGRTLALLLADAGFKVALLEQETHAGKAETDSRTDIRAFALNGTSKALLEHVGAWPSAVIAAVTPVITMAVFGDAGGAAQFEEIDSDASHHSSETCPLNWIVDVPALFDALKVQVAASPYISTLVGHAAPHAKLHVVCEGKHSKLLTELGIEQKTTPYAQHAIAARLACEHPHKHVARQWFNDQGEVLALLPMGGADATANEVALVWSLTSDRAKELLAMNAPDFEAALVTSTGPHLGKISLSSDRALWPLQLTSKEQWVATKDGSLWVLAGDAAHTIHPLAGQGLNLGMGDAALLAETLKNILANSPLFNPSNTNLERALQAYTRERQAAAAELSVVTDGLHLLFARKNAVVQRIRNVGLNLFNRIDWLKSRVIKHAQ